jgi:hypothetical protein
MFKIRPGFLVSVAVALSAAVAPAMAGSIVVSWDQSQGASGYHVYYGTEPGNYTDFVTTTSTTATISGLQDCANYYIAVKAFNSSGESPKFSNELSGWSRPAITSATPSSAMQGDQVVMDLIGSNFQDGAVVDLGNPYVYLASVSVISCNHIQLLATVEPSGSTARPAEIGKLDVTVSNPDAVFGTKSQGFEVLVNPARFDINQSDPVTTNRIDGKDTVYLSRVFGMSESNPNYEPGDDFNGDGWVDGQDLAYIASNLGRCWDASAKTWTLAACPPELR